MTNLKDIGLKSTFIEFPLETIRKSFESKWKKKSECVKGREERETLDMLHVKHLNLYRLLTRSFHSHIFSVQRLNFHTFYLYFQHYFSICYYFTQFPMWFAVLTLFSVFLFLTFCSLLRYLSLLILCNVLVCNV